MNKKAFTLAEVLITLGIIGIVAAMTLPVLSANTRKKEASNRLKKFYSTMQQTIKLSEVDNGDSIYWDKALEIYDEEGSSDTVANAEISEKFFNKYLKPYMKYLSVKKKTDSEDDKDIDFELKVTLLDGSILYLHNGACIDLRLDTNGERKPNKSGYDRFTFLLCTGEKAKQYCKRGNFCSYQTARISNRANAFEMCKNTPAYCSTLLLYDNWEFQDDYPYKI